MDKFIKEYLSNTSNVLSLVNQKIIKDIIFADEGSKGLKVFIEPCL